MSQVTLAQLSPVPRVLSIAGTDPSGGAGTAADMKSITAAGGYAMAAVTALVAQNTHGVRDVHMPPADFLTAQLQAVGEDVTLEAVKTGMLGNGEVISAVSQWLTEHHRGVLVVDPVMVATSGHRLLDQEAEEQMVQFCRLATVVTPNIDELALLTGSGRATDETEALEQAAGWARKTGVSVVVKTGHLDAPLVTNTWVRPDGTTIAIPTARVNTTNTHGTGCSLAAALATRLGRGDSPQQALQWSTTWLHEAIASGAQLQVGSGNGPVDHAHRSRRLAAAGSSQPWLPSGAVPEGLSRPEDLRHRDRTQEHAAQHGSTPHDPTQQNPARPALAHPDPTEQHPTQPDPAHPAVPPAVEPPGPWTRALWKRGSRTIRAIADSAFVRALIDGSLPEASFAFYLNQDALYLARYSRALAAVAASSSDQEAQVFWAGGATNCLTVESELHRAWLGDRPGAAISPVTSSYTNFLLASALGEDTVVGCAAVLPCYWLYAQTGATPAVREGHPYAAWLETYRDPAFVTATQGALGHVEREMAAASPTGRAAAARAFLIACRHELEFFEQALRIDTGEDA
ncbi:MAG TPA: bifunctional hydroxymethylpyrimidine kinase/phosphomethylpyrimidine kinase [Ruania sp.]|nr:bifunctional hydroxymethylpyrimidine kinase/phosphomethylpyrimidine kinase [Ruania sp.]